MSVPTFDQVREALNAFREAQKKEDETYDEYCKAEARYPSIANRQKTRIAYKEWSEACGVNVGAKQTFYTLAFQYLCDLVDNPKESS